MSEMMWGGRFRKAEERSALDFNASVSYDCRMYKEDIAGSLAHASMLADRGIISKEDMEKISGGLLEIKKEIEEGRFEFSVELEDVHMNVEKRLTDDIGDAGARLHTARSRNDQCAADLHMYMRRHIAKLAEKLIAVEEAMMGVSEKYRDVILPGYTHMQRAQPVLFAHHMMAYCAMLQRDFERLVGCFSFGRLRSGRDDLSYHAEGNGRETSFFKMLWKQFGRSFRSRLPSPVSFLRIHLHDAPVPPVGRIDSVEHRRIRIY